jgi:hypothetical protein
MKVDKRSDGRYFRMDTDEYQEMSDLYEGCCIECGNSQEACEPDARNYTCEECGKDQVFGMGELLIMGRIVIED